MTVNNAGIVLIQGYITLLLARQAQRRRLIGAGEGEATLHLVPPALDVLHQQATLGGQPDLTAVAKAPVLKGQGRGWSIRLDESAAGEGRRCGRS